MTLSSAIYPSSPSNIFSIKNGSSPTLPSIVSYSKFLLLDFDNLVYPMTLSMLDFNASLLINWTNLTSTINNTKFFLLTTMSHNDFSTFTNNFLACHGELTRSSHLSSWTSLSKPNPRGSDQGTPCNELSGDWGSARWPQSLFWKSQDKATTSLARSSMLVSMLNAFIIVLLMDNKYKTNIYNLFLLEIVSVIYTRLNFSMKFVLLASEWENFYLGSWKT